MMDKLTEEDVTAMLDAKIRIAVAVRNSDAKCLELMYNVEHKEYTIELERKVIWTTYAKANAVAKFNELFN